jgi:cytochrome bd-type quinol oxidase subunit 2
MLITKKSPAKITSFYICAGLLLLVGLFWSGVLDPAVGALGVDEGLNAAKNGGQSDEKTPDKLISNITSVMMYIVGSVSVIMLIAGGISYATSAGNEEKTKKAKHAVIAALIGLALAVLAYVLVNFVYTNIG